MVAYCSDCRRYVNQYCEICSGNFGVKTCDRYGCEGRMLCPNCGGNNLSSKKADPVNPYDFSKEKLKNKYMKRAASEIEAQYFVDKQLKAQTGGSSASQDTPGGSRRCPLCGYGLQGGWKFCPECGVSLLKK